MNAPLPKTTDLKDPTSNHSPESKPKRYTQSNPSQARALALDPVERTYTAQLSNGEKTQVVQLNNVAFVSFGKTRS